jgi:N-acetylmuramoyl-L-alanine amidase CwlA
MMKTLSLHMQANNGVSTNMGIVYVAPVQNKAGIHFMVNLSDHEVQCMPIREFQRQSIVTVTISC